jgi:hypothetical protein
MRSADKMLIRQYLDERQRMIFRASRRERLRRWLRRITFGLF